MIKLGLSIDDDKIEEELPSLEQDTPNIGESASNKMEEVDWLTHFQWFYITCIYFAILLYFWQFQYTQKLTSFI